MLVHKVGILEGIPGVVGRAAKVVTKSECVSDLGWRRLASSAFNHRGRNEHIHPVGSNSEDSGRPKEEKGESEEDCRKGKPTSCIVTSVMPS